LLLFGLLTLALGLGGHSRGEIAFDKPSLNFNDRGVFVLSNSGRRIGTEKFEIRQLPDKVEARAEIQLHLQQNEKGMDVTTFPDLLMDTQLRPLT
jgi:hypothetical protein